MSEFWRHLLAPLSAGEWRFLCFLAGLDLGLVLSAVVLL